MEANTGGAQSDQGAFKDGRSHMLATGIQELDNLLDDYCFLYGKESDVDVVKNKNGREEKPQRIMFVAIRRCQTILFFLRRRRTMDKLVYCRTWIRRIFALGL